MAVALGLLGSCAAVAALTDSSAGLSRPRSSNRAAAAAGMAAAGMATAGAAALRTGMRMGSPRPASAARSARARSGLLLMSEAAAGCAGLSYSGVQVVVWWGQDGASASVVQVWHRRGSAALAEIPATAVLPGQAQQGGASQEPYQGGILAISSQMLTLMEANYQIAYSGRGTADSRPADVVELRRPDGSLAARFWLDSVTKLPLRREVYGPGSAMISEDAFIDLDMGDRGLGRAPAAEVQPWTEQLDPARLTALRGQGWPLPASVAGNFSLFRASQTSTAAGPVVDLSYSDGLSVVSVFLQRGQLPRALPGWQRVAVSGQSVLSNDPDNRSLAWSAHGFVFTVIADAPSVVLSQVVTDLPHDSQAGLWQRMTRGMRRLASWANPFG